MRYNKFIILILMAVSFASCNKYLETESSSTFTEQTAYNNLDFAQKAVYGIYDLLTDYQIYGKRLSFYYNMDNDIEQIAGSPDNGRRDIARFAATDGNTELQKPWTYAYNDIERANMAIDNLPKSPIWEGEYADQAHQLYGEAVTLRALLYYELVRNWGDIPFKTKSTQDGDDFYLQKTDRDSIYEALVADLARVEDDVPWLNETMTSERINKAFVKGLRARIALTYAGYSLRNKTFETKRGRHWQDYYKIARDECSDIMKSGRHRLNPDYKQIFKNLHAFSMDLTYGEVLFDIAFGKGISGSVGEFIGMGFSTNPADPKYGRASAEVRTNPLYFYSFDPKDTRRNVTVELYDYHDKNNLSKQRLGSPSGLYICKWRRSWIDPPMGGDQASVSFTGVNWPIMRYSDVVLMFAEAENELNNGPTADAKNALTLIRQRAFPEEVWGQKVTHYIDSVSVGKESFFNAIVNERAWEFGGEMLRKGNLIRWNLYGEKIRRMKEENLKLINDDPAYKNVPNYLFWRYESDNETIDILNPDYRLPGNEIPGYTKTSWMSMASSSSKSSFSGFLDLIGSGYDAAKNNSLYPISAAVIADSNGKLSNDQVP